MITGARLAMALQRDATNCVPPVKGVKGQTAMSLAKNVKTALDETRTMILGAQILLGFQHQSVFQDRFDQLPIHARISSACALALMLATVGLLIASSAFHRIGEHGESTARARTSSPTDVARQHVESARSCEPLWDALQTTLHFRLSVRKPAASCQQH
jgi:hypothetical protein